MTKMTAICASCRTHEHCINKALRQAELICERSSLRLTPLRRKVLVIIWENHKPAKAYDILDKLKSQETAAKPSTVYRALNFLLESGLIHKLEGLNAYIGCSHPCAHPTCYFLICSCCGDIQECCHNHLTDAIASTAHQYAFHLQHSYCRAERHLY